MKTILILFLTNLLIFQCYSQSDSVSKKDWVLSFNYAPNYTYRTSEQISYKYKPGNYRTDDQIPKYGWHTGILLSKSINRILWIETGFRINNLGFKTSTIYDTVYNKYRSEVEAYSYKMDYRLFGSPINIIGKFKVRKKLFISIQLGFTYYYMEKDRRKRIGAHAEKYSGQGFVNNIGVDGSIGFNYAIRNMYISFSPHCNYIITPTHDGLSRDGDQYNLNLYSMGVEFGLHYYMLK